MRLPQPFGKYLLLERISVGGMAEVFKAKAFGVEGFEKIIAIKKILPSMAEDADFIQMFIDEAKICSQLNHANVCQVFELGKIEESHFIAMEYIWGKDLLQIQNRFRRLRKNMSLQMAAFCASKVCEGLDYAHRKKDANGKPLNIIHRDVSPQNIIVSYEGEAKVIDFGIAKAASRSSKTQAGVLKGKFGYMSPEQVGGKTLDRRADVFAIGTILYEILTNERLFLGESDFATLEKVRNVSIPPPSQVRKDIPEALDKIIMKALAKEVEQRYQWASEMADDLQDFLAQTEPVYNSKQLSLWMRENFASEMKKEGQVLEEQRKIGKEAMSAAPLRKQTVPPSARLKASTLAPAGPAGSAVSMPGKAPEPAAEEEGHTLIEDAGEEVAEVEEDKGTPAAAPLAGEATAIVMPGQSPAAPGGHGGGEIASEATRVLDPNIDKPAEDLPGVATQVFNPGEHQPAPAPTPAAPPQAQLAPPIIAPMDPYAASALMAAGQMQQLAGLMQGQNPSMVGPMAGFPPGMMPYGTGAFAIVPAPGGTGMMMLPQGMVPGMFPGQPPPAPARGGLLKDVLIGVGVAIAVVALVLGVKFALTPGKGMVVLNVIPSHAATIYIDGKEHGRLEANNSYVIRDLPRGPHLMLVRAEDGEAQQSFDLASDMLQLAVQLSAANGGSQSPAANNSNTASQGSGTIRLRLPPEGALVSINGRLVSEKEVQKGFLVPAGVANEVKVSKAGKREERFTVTLSAGQEVERTIELKDGRGKLSITSKPAGADVLINGRVYGKAPLTVEDLDPTKAVKLTLKKRGSGTVTRTVSFDSSLEQNLDIDLGSTSGKDDDRGSSSATSGSSGSSSGSSSSSAATGGADGFLIANTHPWAKVFIDNKDSGKTTPIGPRDRIPMKPGKHTVTFVTNDKRLAVEVVIRPGEESKIVRDLNEN